MTRRPRTTPRVAVCLVSILGGFGLGCGGEGALGVEQPTAAAAPAADEVALPRPRGGADRLGVDVRGILPAGWLAALAPPAGTGQADALLVRWWTVGCPFCERSLPAIEGLRADLEARGLATLAVFHPKPPRAATAAEAEAAALELGYAGPVALDPDWGVLRSLWLDTGTRAATSASFLIDSRGALRFVHPGPEFFPSDDSAHAGPAADHADLRAAIELLVGD